MSNAEVVFDPKNFYTGSSWMVLNEIPVMPKVISDGTNPRDTLYPGEILIVQSVEKAPDKEIYMIEVMTQSETTKLFIINGATTKITNTYVFNGAAAIDDLRSLKS